VSRATVEAYFAAINADSFADLAKVFTPDVEIHTVGTRPVVGREAALAHFPRILARFTEHDDQVTRWIDTPDAIVTEILFEGRLAGGRPVSFEALDVFDVADGVITRVTTWYDTRDVRRQVADRTVDSSSVQRREEAG
jgi:limonene-1,2-epoxide hydrolase